MTYRRRTLKHLLLVAGTGLMISACGGGDSVGDTKDSPVTEPFFPAPEEEWELKLMVINDSSSAVSLQ